MIILVCNNPIVEAYLVVSSFKTVNTFSNSVNDNVLTAVSNEVASNFLVQYF